MDNRRYYGLDALRGGMMLLGIVLHAGEFYMASPPPQAVGFPVDPRSTSFLFDVVFHFIHSFRMPLFFVLAGFFAALLVEKRGMAATYKDRAKRILAPLLVGCLTIVPLTMLLALDFMLAARFGVMDLVPDRALLHQLARELQAMGAPVDQLSIFHFWFLLYLCYFYLAMPACRFAVRKLQPAAPKVTAFLASPLALLCLGLFTAATLWPYRGGQVLEGFLFLKPHLPSIVYYGSFFAFGYLLHSHREVLKAFERLAPLCTGLALLLFPASLYASHLEYYATGDITYHHLVAVLLNGFCTWTLIYAFTGWMLRLFDRESPWILYISQSAYWSYLVHMVFILVPAWLLVPYALPAIAKFAINLAVAALGCFLTYHYLVRRTWVGVFLHGKRFDQDWPWRAPSGAKLRAEA